MVPKQHKEYHKKNPIAVPIPHYNLFDGFVGNLTTNIFGGTTTGTQLGQLDSVKTYGGGDVVIDMPPLEDASDHDTSSPRQNLSRPISNKVKVLESTIAVDTQVVTQTKVLESQIVVDSHVVTAQIDVIHVLVCSNIVVVPSPPRENSPMAAQSLALTLQNHFSSLDGLETANEAGGPNTGKPIVPTSIDSKFWADRSETEETTSDTGGDIVRITRKSRRSPKRACRSKKHQRQFHKKKSQ